MRGDFLSKALASKFIGEIARSSQNPTNEINQLRGRDERQRMLRLIQEKSEAIVAMREEINTLAARLSKPDRVDFDDMCKLGHIIAEGLFTYAEHAEGCPAREETTHDNCKCGLLSILEQAVEYRSRY